MKIIIDASTFILWSDVSFMELIVRKKLLKEVIEEIIITPQVYSEIKDSLSSQFLADGLRNGVFSMGNCDENHLNAISVKYKLGKGEISCMAFCLQNQEYVFLSDDKIAIKKAKREGLKTLSTDKLLHALLEKGLVDKNILQKFIEKYPTRFKK